MLRYRAPNPFLENLSYFELSQDTSSEFTAKKILASLLIQPEAATPERLAKLADEYKIEVTRFTVETHDDATLDSIQMTPLGELSKPISDRKFIIKLNGSGRLYNNLLDSFAYDAKELSATVIGFDYRGVSYSTKIPLRLFDLIVDGIAQVQFLLALGAQSENITIDGYSIGAFIGTFVASYYHYHKQSVYLFNDRSLTSLLTLFAAALEARMPVLSFFKPLVEWGMNIKAWEGNVIAAYKIIPRTNKAHMFIASETSKAGSKGDGNIPHSISFHRGVKNIENENPPTTGYKLLAHSSLFPDAPYGHKAARSQLISKDDQTKTAQDIFEGFVRRSHKE